MLTLQQQAYQCRLSLGSLSTGSQENTAQNPSVVFLHVALVTYYSNNSFRTWKKRKDGRVDIP